MATLAQRRLDLLDFEDLKKSWGWIVAVGILQILLGAVAIGAFTVTTVVSVALFGWLLFSGGIVAIIHGFRQKRWSGFFLDLAIGALYSIAGLMVFSHPAAAAASLTLVLAMFLMAGGVLRIVATLARGVGDRFRVLLNGVVTLALGIMIWRQWPLSGLWIIGLYIGIEMVVYGSSLVMLGLAARRGLPEPTDRTAATPA